MSDYLSNFFLIEQPSKLVKLRNGLDLPRIGKAPGVLHNES